MATASRPHLSTAFKPHLPKADMHVHLEGTLSPDMARKLAARNGVVLRHDLFTADGGSYALPQDGSAADCLRAFLAAYDDACAAIRCAQDYTDITHDYLSRSAAEGCIYAEITISADHGRHIGLSYAEMLDAITAGYLKAKAETGIEARLISTCVRHYGAEGALRVGAETNRHPHVLVTGFGMAGDENAGTVADFQPAFDAARLKNRTVHAGEAAGPESVRAARDLLGCRRFGHMVRAIEDAALMQDLISIRAVPEVCVSSNLVLKVYDGYAAHPLRVFFDRGLRVTLGSDDPAFFHTSIGREYEIAQTQFGFSDRELLQLTRNAVEEAFVDDATRATLLQKVAGAEEKIAA